MVSWGVFEATYPSLWVHHLFIVYIYITVYIYIYILGGVSHLVSEKLFPHIAITLKILPYIYMCVWNIPSCIWIINYLLSEMHIQAGWIEYDIEYERGLTSAKDPEVRHGE